MNPDDVWIGTASGGVWHSLDGGLNFEPESDQEDGLAIGAIALDGCSASGCTRIFAGTGENAIRRDTYYGAGLLVGAESGGGDLDLLVDPPHGQPFRLPPGLHRQRRPRSGHLGPQQARLRHAVQRYDRGRAGVDGHGTPSRHRIRHLSFGRRGSDLRAAPGGGIGRSQAHGSRDGRHPPEAPLRRLSRPWGLPFHQWRGYLVSAERGDPVAGGLSGCQRTARRRKRLRFRRDRGGPWKSGRGLRHLRVVPRPIAPELRARDLPLSRQRHHLEPETRRYQQPRGRPLHPPGPGLQPLHPRPRRRSHQRERPPSRRAAYLALDRWGRQLHGFRRHRLRGHRVRLAHSAPRPPRDRLPQRQPEPGLLDQRRRLRDLERRRASLDAQERRPPDHRFPRPRLFAAHRSRHRNQPGQRRPALVRLAALAPLELLRRRRLLLPRLRRPDAHVRRKQLWRSSSIHRRREFMADRQLRHQLQRPAPVLRSFRPGPHRVEPRRARPLLRLLQPALPEPRRRDELERR